MSGAMLHGMGDCTPSLHCGCMSHAPLREQVVALTAERDDLRATVARVEAQAAAKALRDAADAIDFAMAYERPDGPECRDAEAVAEVWLRERADRIERGDA